MKIYKVVPLGQNDEKGEQLENEKFREKKLLLLLVRRVSSHKLRQNEKILGFLVGSEWWEGWAVVKSKIKKKCFIGTGEKGE